MRGECVRQRSNVKVGGFTALRGFNHTTRANISHEKAEQIRARIVCTPAESARRELTHMRSMCVGVAETGGLTHMRSMCVGVAETGASWIEYVR